MNRYTRQTVASSRRSCVPACEKVHDVPRPLVGGFHAEALERAVARTETPLVVSNDAAFVQGFQVVIVNPCNDEIGACHLSFCKLSSISDIWAEDLSAVSDEGGRGPRRDRARMCPPSGRLHLHRELSRVVERGGIAMPEELQMCCRSRVAAIRSQCPRTRAAFAKVPRPSRPVLQL